MTRIPYPFTDIQPGAYLYFRPDWNAPRLATVTVDGDKKFVSFAIDIERHPRLMQLKDGYPWMDKIDFEAIAKDAYFQTPEMKVEEDQKKFQKLIDAANGILFLFPSQDYPDSTIGGMALKDLENTIKEIGGEIRRPREEKL